MNYMRAGFDAVLFYSWMIGAGALVAAVLGWLAFRDDTLRAPWLWTAIGVLLAPWIICALDYGTEMLEAQVLVMSFRWWDPTMPTAFSLAVAIGLGVARLRRLIKDNPLTSQPSS
jgi:hypothetical protein